MHTAMRTITTLLLLLWLNLSLAATSPDSSSWQPDILGQGYEMRTVEQGKDYSGRVVSTIVRKLVADSIGTRRGVLYVHGFNDYFFNAPMGNEFVEHGYDFYAVDLRKYGRSILQGQKLFQARNLNEYFPDIDSALVVMQRTGLEEIVLMGHSTGGLISAYYIACNPQAPVEALILNSPFLDWNLGWKECLVPIISWWGTIAPDTPIPQGKSTAYAQSLLRSEHGYWDYNTSWKLPQSPDVTAGWVHAITQAQNALRNGKARISIPILLMYSSASVNGAEWTEEHNHADGVLDVADIRKYGRQLGPHVTCMKVVGGLHDLTLSNPALLKALYPAVFHWLGETFSADEAESARPNPHPQPDSQPKL